jgi:adenylate cyclase
MIEIERKFLVTSTSFMDEAFSSKRIVQAYICSDPERTVRIRIKETRAFITIKGKGNESGTTRMEWEKEIPVSEAEHLLSICEKGTIDKIRYDVKSGNHLFEVDVFTGENEGLIIAEIELKNENEPFSKPTWLGEEVTHDKRYYNAYISQNPYKNWTTF